MSLKSDPEVLSNIYTVEPAGNRINIPDHFGAGEPSLADTEGFEVAGGGWVKPAGEVIGEVFGRAVSPLKGGQLAKASKLYAEKVRRQRELEKTIETAGTDEAGKLKAELDIETRYDIVEVDGGFEAVDAATNTVLAKYTTEAEAKKFLVNFQGEADDLGPRQARSPEADEVDAPLGPLPESPADIPPSQRMGPEREAAELPGEAAATAAEAAARRKPVQDDPYAHWVSLDDDAINIVAEGMFNRPEAKDGMIGNMRVTGADGDPKIVDEGHVYGLIESTGAAMKARLDQLGIDEVTRISNQETERLANVLGSNPNKLIEQLMGGRFQLGVGNPGELAATMHAAKSLLIAEIRKLDELADIALGRKGAELVSDSARYAWVRQNELVANLKRHYLGARSDIARAQQINRLPAADARLTTEQSEQMIARNFAHSIDELGGSEAVDSAIAAYRDLDDVAQRLGFGSQLTRTQKWLDAVHEVFIHNLLSGWFTHVKNTAGVVSTLVADIGEMTTAATLQLPRAARGQQRSVTYGDVSAKLFGELMSGREALIAGMRSFWLREEPPGLEMTITGETKHNFGRIRRDAWSAEAMELEGFWGSVVDWSGQLLTLGRAPTRALMAEDTTMKVVAYRGSLWEEAYRQARLKNLDGDAGAEFMAEFAFNPPLEAATAAKDFAKYVTLQSEMHGVLRDMQKVASNRFVRLILPFYKTPTNAVLYLGHRTPAARIFKHYQDARKEGGAAAAKAKARAAMGTALMGYLAIEWDQDTITGNLSSDPGVLQAYKRMGMERNALRVGDSYWNYKFFEPWSMVGTMVASTMEIVAHPDVGDDDAFEILGAVSGALGQSMTNTTFMSGVSMMLDVMTNPDRHGERFAYGYMRALIPGSAALNEFRKAMDPLMRLKTDYLDVWRDRLPGLSANLPPQRDLWGRVKIPNRWRTAYKPNVVDKEIVRLELNFPTKHPTTVDGVGLKPKEIDWFHKRAGELAFEMLKALTDPKSKKVPYVTETVGLDTWTKWRRDYAEAKRLSETGDELATQECKNMLRGMLQEAQKIAIGELLVHPEHGADIMDYKLKAEAYKAERRALSIQGINQ